jgi:hypothetical protein
VVLACLIVGLALGGSALARKSRSSGGAQAPVLTAPGDDARAGSVPAFSWLPVKRAAKYEFQLSADDDFGSVVLGQGRGSFQTVNTFATIDKTLPNGTYHWRVRAIDGRDNAGRWSPPRSLTISWTDRPTLIGPAIGASVSYPRVPLVLQWSRVPRAYKYLVEIATDPSLASPIGRALGGVPETSGTVYAFNDTLAPGRYYWAITPEDAEKHKGARSAVGWFDWSWPTETSTRVTDLSSDPRLFDPQFSWDPVPGAARYEVEVNSSQDFAFGSKVCCTDLTTATSLSPKKVLPNNHFYWRVRALDLGGNAGTWNIGPEFDKSFDMVASPDTPIPNLHLRDNQVDALPAGATTSSPVVTWDPVPGASSYEVQVVPFIFGGCNWTSTSSDTWTQTRTAATAWTPLGSGWNGRVPGGVSYPSAANDGGKALVSGQSYCVRVLARSDRDQFNHEVVSDWSQLGGNGSPAFTFEAPSLDPPPAGPLTTPAVNYRLPLTGTITPRLPLFTWTPVAGAASYFVVIARDAAFTDIVDLAFTQLPAYAPRIGTAPKTYPDETTSYFWAVMSAKGANGDNVTSYPWQNSPQALQKRSTPPTLVDPAPGADVSTQPTFHWTAAEGAREYRLQVSQDPTFSNPLDDVVTNSTAYTSSTAYPADTALYWRVRADDENRIGLTWSATGSFRRRLPAPVLNPDNPSGGETVPVINWSVVQGATSYEMHVDQPDGTTRDLPTGSTAFTAVIFYGTGVWHWKVRARFPKSPSGETPGPYSAPQAYTRRIDAPAGGRDVNTPHHMLLSWDPAPMAKEYRVQIAATDSFSAPIDTHTVQGTDYAPLLSQPGFRAGGKLYWRVAAVDEGGNVGAWAARPLLLRKAMRVTAAGLLFKRERGIAVVTVTDAKGRPVRGARVSPSGAGVHTRPKRSGKKGKVRFRIRARRRGTVVFRARKGGFAPGAAALRIR